MCAKRERAKQPMGRPPFPKTKRAFAQSQSGWSPQSQSHSHSGSPLQRHGSSSSRLASKFSRSMDLKHRPAPVFVPPRTGSMRGSKNPPCMIILVTNSLDLSLSGIGAVKLFPHNSENVKSVLLNVPRVTALPGEHSPCTLVVHLPSGYGSSDRQVPFPV